LLTGEVQHFVILLVREARHFIRVRFFSSSNYYLFGAVQERDTSNWVREGAGSNPANPCCFLRLRIVAQG